LPLVRAVTAGMHRPASSSRSLYPIGPSSPFIANVQYNMHDVYSLEIAPVLTLNPAEHTLDTGAQCTRWCPVHTPKHTLVSGVRNVCALAPHTPACQLASPPRNELPLPGPRSGPPNATDEDHWLAPRPACYNCTVRRASTQPPTCRGLVQRALKWALKCAPTSRSMDPTSQDGATHSDDEGLMELEAGLRQLCCEPSPAVAHCVRTVRRKALAGDTDRCVTPPDGGTPSRRGGGWAVRFDPRPPEGQQRGRFRLVPPEPPNPEPDGLTDVDQGGDGDGSWSRQHCKNTPQPTRMFFGQRKLKSRGSRKQPKHGGRLRVMIPRVYTNCLGIQRSIGRRQLDHRGGSLSTTSDFPPLWS
jgi:hypothetical protein